MGIDTNIIGVIVSDMKSARPYAMKARAEGTAATRARLLASAALLLARHAFDDITLDAIATSAGTTVRTALRLFASKELLFAAVLGAQGTDAPGPARPDDIDATLDALYDFYEVHGDTVIRWLADEHRLPAMAQHLAGGRANLRRWVADSFPAALAADPGTLLDALIVALDVYAWKLTRRDFGLDRAAAQAVARRIVTALIEGD
jgi:AcrR family transcriptional regulator